MFSLLGGSYFSVVGDVFVSCGGCFFGVVFSGMENKSRYVVEQFWHERGTRVVVKRVCGGFRGWVGNNSGVISALSVLLVAGIGVVGAVTSVVGWNNTSWALGFLVSAVVLCVLVAGVFSGGVKSWVGIPDVVVDHVFEVKGGFGPGLEDLLNDDVFGVDALRVLMESGREDDVRVIEGVNQVWSVYRKSLSVGVVTEDVLGEVSNRMSVLSDVLDDVDAISRRENDV